MAAWTVYYWAEKRGVRWAEHSVVYLVSKSVGPMAATKAVR